MRLFLFCLAGLLAPTALLSFQAPLSLKPAVVVTHPPLEEMSGIVPSRRYPGIFWVHNDSGDEARLFAIRADGSVTTDPTV